MAKKTTTKRKPGRPKGSKNKPKKQTPAKGHTCECCEDPFWDRLENAMNELPELKPSLWYRIKRMFRR